MTGNVATLTPIPNVAINAWPKIDVSAKGKITGISNVTNGADVTVIKVKGKVKSKNGVLTVSYTYNEKSLIAGVKGKVSYKVTATLNGTELVGTKKEGKVITGYSETIVDTSGNYNLDFSGLGVDAKGKYSGTVTLTLLDFFGSFNSSNLS